jgi:hypothetical protein
MDKIAIVLFGLVAVLGSMIAFALLLSIPTWLLWNGCLVDAVAGVREIGLLQALGLNILCGILFKSTIKKS